MYKIQAKTTTVTTTITKQGGRFYYHVIVFFSVIQKFKSFFTNIAFTITAAPRPHYNNIPKYRWFLVSIFAEGNSDLC